MCVLVMQSRGRVRQTLLPINVYDPSVTVPLTVGAVPRTSERSGGRSSSRTP